MSSISSMLSRLWESDPSSDTSGRMSERSGSSGERSTGARATAHWRLPSMVLISPLCASRRNGWASRHCGKRIGRKALVKHRHRGLEPGVSQVGIELDQVLGHDHALVDNGAGREAGAVEPAIRPQNLLGPAPGQEQLAIEGGLVGIARGGS